MIREYKIKYYNGFNEEIDIVKAYTAEDAITQLKNSNPSVEHIVSIESYIKPETYGWGADIGG